MKNSHLAAALLLVAAAGAAPADDPQVVVITGERDADWASYRHAYKAAAFFERHTRTRPLIQAHFQIRPNRPDTPMDGLQVTLAGEKTQVLLPLDALGRATLPMLKQAYDEDAVLRLNRPKGLYHFSGRYSIRERADGRYRAAELRAACEQLIGAQRASGYRLRLIGKKCVGVKFVYPAADSGATIAFHGAAGEPATIGVVDGHPFENPTMGSYKVAVFRFADWPAEGEVIAAGAPLAIGTVYE